MKYTTFACYALILGVLLSVAGQLYGECYGGFTGFCQAPGGAASTFTTTLACGANVVTRTGTVTQGPIKWYTSRTGVDGNTGVLSGSACGDYGYCLGGAKWYDCNNVLQLGMGWMNLSDPGQCPGGGTSCP